jgi:flavin-dependent dehydrogenase
MTEARSVDVAVVGGGPAGLVTAALLARRRRRVVLFERSRYDAPRAGETLNPLVRALLEPIGAWEDIAAAPEMGVALRGVHSAWGGEDLAWRSSMMHPLGEGLNVDRARFDGCLASFAERAGATVVRGAGGCRVARDTDGFLVTPARGAPVRARFLVDASGRGAPASARAVEGHRWLALDRQIAIMARTPRAAATVGDTELCIEAVEGGWWYSAPQPRDDLVVALITDADLFERGDRPQLGSRFAAALARTRHTRARAGAPVIAGDAVRIVRADSGRLLGDRAPGFRAVGDAAFASDPLAGNGVASALHSAITAAPEIDAAVDGVEQPPGEDPFAEYLDLRGRYYLMEERFADAPFWARRRPIDYRTAEITIAPTARFRRGPVAATRDALAPVESLVPPRALAGLVAALDAPLAAHEAMRILREAAPIGDLRLLVGLQLAVGRGLVAVE